MTWEFANYAVRRLRPRLWPLLWVHFLAGLLAAGGAPSWPRGLLAGAIWSALLAGPAVALMEVFSPADDARPPADRERLGWLALAMLLAGLALSAVVSWDFCDVFRLGLLVAALLVAPPLRLGGRPVVGTLLQAIGCGGLTFYAGMVAGAADIAGVGAGASVEFRLAGFVLLFLALRALSMPDLSRPHAPTLPHFYFWAALGGAFACLAIGGVVGGEAWNATLLVIPLGAWVVAGLNSLDRARGGQFTGPVALAGAWLLTDVAVVCAALLR